MNFFGLTIIIATTLFAIPIASQRRPRRPSKPTIPETNGIPDLEWMIPTTENSGDTMSYMEKAACIPEIKMISIKSLLPGSDHSSYFPTCVKVKQCQGCCMGNRKCISTRNITTEHKIWKKGQKEPLIVTVTENEVCDCGCKFKESCNFTNAKYDEMMCSCGCRNFREKFNCLFSKHETHIWREEKCICDCREEKKCSTSLTWNADICQCVSTHSNIKLYSQIYE